MPVTTLLTARLSPWGVRDALFTAMTLLLAQPGTRRPDRGRRHPRSAAHPRRACPTRPAAWLNDDADDDDADCFEASYLATRRTFRDAEAVIGLSPLLPTFQRAEGPITSTTTKRPKWQNAALADLIWAVCLFRARESSRRRVRRATGASGPWTEALGARGFTLPAPPDGCPGLSACCARRGLSTRCSSTLWMHPACSPTPPRAPHAALTCWTQCPRLCRSCPWCGDHCWARRSR